jgi:precorrin-6B methylase 2/mono/diheme cytochrome c family protein
LSWKCPPLPHGDRPRIQAALEWLRSALRIAGAAVVSLATVAAQGVPSAERPDAGAGARLFAAGGCRTCHSVEAGGAARGPDLSMIGLLRSPKSLRASLAKPAHVDRLSSADIEHLVAYLRTLRAIPPSEPAERTRTIAPITENVAFFDRSSREAEEQSDALVDALEIGDGSRIADVGAGTGYFTWRLARHAGPAGKVIAVDIQQSMLNLAAENVKAHGVLNVEYVLGTEGDPKLPPQSLDMVFIAHSYHEFAQPEAMMERIRRSLKPGGRLVIVEYKKENRAAPASTLHRMSFDEIRDEVEQTGFDLDRILDFLPVQHGLIFTVR